MGKRKSVGTQPMDDSDDDGQASDHSSGSSAPSLIDVDFDFFPPSPDVDLIALKRLLRQLLYSDSDLLDLHPLAELLLAEALDAGVGSTIKVDGEDSDPFSFMGVINLNLHQANPVVLPLLQYLQKQSAASKPLHNLLSALPPSGTPGPQVGLIVSERLINMPVQTQPPMWRMLGDEISAAAQSGKPYSFTHYILLSKLYLPPTLPKSKKASKKKNKQLAEAEAMDVDSADLTDGLLPFHPEDSLLARFASHSITYPFTKAPSRDAEDPLEFGLDQRGGLMLLDFSSPQAASGQKWAELVKVLEDGCV